jgi:hypothetical protein
MDFRSNSKALLASVPLLCLACTMEIRDEITPERIAVRRLWRYAIAEGGYQKEHGRYGSEAELRDESLFGLSQAEKRSPQMALYDYVLRTDTTMRAFSVTAVPKRNSGINESFYIDETYVLRVSWGPGVASPESRPLSDSNQ